MPQLRLTFIGIGLFVNRPVGLAAVLPALTHTLYLTGPFGRKKVPMGSDIQICANDKPLALGSTHRADTEYIVHLDHTIGQKVACPPALLAGKIPEDVNARVFLTGGRLRALPAVVLSGLLRNVVWDFTTPGQGQPTHSQKLTDSAEYAVSLTAGQYEVQVRRGKKLDRFKFTIENSDVDLTLQNDDQCPYPGILDYKPNEFNSLYDLVGAKRGQPVVEGRPTSGLPREIPRTLVPARVNAAAGCICDPICAHAQIDSDK